MKLAIVALAASLTILATVVMNLGGDGSELPLPAVIELQGRPPSDVPTAALASPLEPPALPPLPPPAQEAAKRPPTTLAAGEQGAPRQAVVTRRSVASPATPSPLPAEGGVEEVRRHVASSSTVEYRYACDEDADDRDECDDDEEADADDREKRADDDDDDDD